MAKNKRSIIIPELDGLHTSGPITIEPAAGGYALRAASVGNGYFSGIGVAVQRDPHPIFGGGITDETAKANATLWAAVEDLLKVAKLVALLADPEFTPPEEVGHASLAKAVRALARQATEAIAKAGESR